MSYVNPDTIHRPANGMVAPAAWGDQVNDDLNYLYGQLSGVRAMIGARMYQNTGQTLTTGAGYYQVSLDTQDFVGATGSPTCSTTSHNMTINTAGKYLVTGRLATSYPTGQTGPQPSVAVYKNGAVALQATGNYMAGNPSGIGPTVEVSSLVVLAAADVLTLYAATNTSGYAIATEGGSTAWSSFLSVLYVGS